MKLSKAERAVLREVALGIPEGERPYAIMGKRARVTEDECLSVVRALVDRGVIRRVAAVVRDRDLGYAGNAMVAWRVSPGNLERAGTAAAARPEVSHAYARRATPAWPFDLYTMIHGRTRGETLAIVEELAEAIGAGFPPSQDARRVLFTLREFTKRRPDYSAVLGDGAGPRSGGGSDM